MNEPKFKVGDRVKLLTTSLIGSIGTIIKVEPSDSGQYRDYNYYNLEFENDTGIYGRAEEELELVIRGSTGDSPPAIYFKITPALRTAIDEIAATKEIKHFPAGLTDGFVYIAYAGSKKLKPEVAFAVENDEWGEWGWKEVTRLEFLIALENLPDKPKNTILKGIFIDYDVEISATGIKVGCQEFGSKEIKKLRSWVSAHRREETFYEPGLKRLTIPAPEHIKIDGGYTLTFEDFDKIMAAYDEFKVK